MLGLSQIGVTVAAFCTQILLARALPQSAFGTFSAALAVMALAAPLVVFGVSELWLQRFGLEGHAARRWVRPSLRLVAGLCVGVLAAALVWSLVGKSDPAATSVRALLTSVIVAQVGLTLVASAQQLRGDYRGLSVLQVAPHVGRVLVVLASWAVGLSVVAVAVGYAVVALLTVVACIAVMRPFVAGTMPLEGHRDNAAASTTDVPVSRVVTAATPFVLGNVFYLMGIYLGTIVAAEVLGPEAAALLAVPMAVITAAYLVPRVVYQQYFLAKLHRWAHGDRDAVLLAYRFGTSGMVVLGILVAGPVALGGQLLPVLLGPGYGETAAVLAVLALAVPFRFGGAAAAALLTSGGLLRRKVVHQGIGALMLLAALAVATPMWGVRGTASATVVAEGVLCVLFWVTARRHVVRDGDLPSWHDLRRRLTRGSPSAS
ncbi:lipopolysaccharide biosynthesis protein [Micromonospora palythoicola]|uniref:lipopolysaccharide biosynthesis protein n=1 Tax=Micromonospora palythoicola TaxID=3120507 RepID=UPI002FCE432D